MTIVFTRIDQRLIHGITVNQWFSEIHPTRFMVIDDEISKNELVKSSMRMSKPNGTSMSIIDTSKAINNITKGNYDNQRVFILVKEPETLLKLIKAGVQIASIDVGIIFNEGNRKEVTDRVAMSEKEFFDLKEINKMGTEIYLQYRPEDSIVKFDKILSKMEG